MKQTTVGILTVLLLFAIFGFAFYPHMPDDMASHWNAKGQVNSYMGKFWGVALIPIIAVAITLLYIIIPKIDPLHKNIKSFQTHFDVFLLMIVIFLFYCYVLTLIYNKGVTINIAQFMAPGLAILFYYVGIMCEHTKRNYFIGIRTPWTLANDHVWEKTHEMGANMFKITGIFSALGFVLPKLLIFFLGIPLLALVVNSFVYSYVEYQNIENKNSASETKKKSRSKKNK